MTYQDYERERREFLTFVNSLPHCEIFDKNQGAYGSEEMKSFEGVCEEAVKLPEFYRG